MKEIETYYKRLVEELYKQLKAGNFPDLEKADEHYFKIETPEQLKVKNLRNHLKGTNSL